MFLAGYDDGLNYKNLFNKIFHFVNILLCAGKKFIIILEKIKHPFAGQSKFKLVLYQARNIAMDEVESSFHFWSNSTLPLKLCLKGFLQWSENKEMSQSVQPIFKQLHGIWDWAMGRHTLTTGPFHWISFWVQRWVRKKFW